jgi:hypothetical protein
MKSREAFNPSKPFVFPPIIKRNVFQSGCGTLIVGTVLAVVAISAISALINTPTPTASTTPTPPTVAPVITTPVPASHRNTDTGVTTPTPTPTTPLPPDSGPVVALKDDSTFPSTVVISTHADIVTSTGGFGLDPGDEVTVDSRQTDGAYVISHGGQQFTVAAKLIDDAKVK